MSFLLDIPSESQNLIASCPSVVRTHLANSVSNFLARLFVFADNFESIFAYLFTTTKGLDLDAGFDADFGAGLLAILGSDFELTFCFDFLEPNTSPQTLFSIALNVSLIAVFATSHPIPLHLALLTQDKISLLHCLLLVSGEPQHWSCSLQHASRESFA